MRVEFDGGLYSKCLPLNTKSQAHDISECELEIDTYSNNVQRGKSFSEHGSGWFSKKHTC